MWPLGVLWGGFLESLGEHLGAPWGTFGSFEGIWGVPGDRFLMFLEIFERQEPQRADMLDLQYLLLHLYGF